MKPKFFTFFLITLFFVFKLSAQVQYTESEFGVVGDSVIYSTLVPTPGPGGNNYTTAGANVTWNYATLVPTASYTLYFLNPATAGYMADFISQCVTAGGTNNGCTSQFNALTNVAFMPQPDSVRAGTVTFDNIIQHDLNSNNQLIDNILGLTTHINGQPVSFTVNYTQPDVVRQFPISYGNEDSSFSSYIIDLTPYGSNTIIYSHTKRVNVDDAWGNLTTPFGNFPNTVREYTTVTQTDTIVTNGTSRAVPPTTTFEYDWFDPAHAAPVFVASGTIGGGGGGGGGAPRVTRVSYLVDSAACFPPRARVRITPANPAINPSLGNVTVTFTDNTTGATSYFWNFGDPTSGASDTSTVKSPTHSYDTTGTYIVEFIACTAACCDTTYYPVTVVDSGVPTARFTARPATTCVNDTVTFRNTSTGAASYYWSFGDGDTSTLQAPTYVYTAAGTYTVTLIAYNTIGTDTVRHNVTIQTPPVATVQVVGPLTFCNGDSVILSASGGGTYRWSTGRRTPSITVKTSGTYVVTVTNSCGSDSSAPIVVTVTTPVDTIVALTDTAFCQGDSVGLQANIATGGTYTWKRNGQIIAGATNNIYYAKTSGLYEVNIKVDSCVGVSNEIRVTVSPAPTAHIHAVGSTTNCSGDSVQLVANNGGGLTYQWQVNGQNVTGAVTNPYYALNSGTYDVVVTRNGCSTTSNTIIVANNSTPAPVISYTGNPAFCQGDSLYMSTAPGAGYTFQWQLNGQNIAGATDQFIYAATAGSYDVIVTAGACAGTSPAVGVTSNPVPVANAGTPQTIIACSSASPDTLGGHPAASGGTAPYVYTWSPPSGLSATNVPNPLVSSIGSTTEYHLQVTDNNGCAATDSVQITVTGGTGISVGLSAVGDRSWCFGTKDSLVITAHATGGTVPYTYSWTPDTLVSSLTDSVTVVAPTAVGNYLITVVVIDHNGCQGSASGPAVVIALPNDSVIALGNTTFCQGDSLTLSAAPGTNYEYQWLNNGAPLAGATNINYTTYASGSYSVQISNSTCVDTSAPTVVSAVAPPVAQITTSGSLNLCAGQTTLLSASTGNNYTYQWYEDDGGIGGATGSTYSAGDSASYYVVVTEGTCSAQSDSVVVTVNQYPADSVAVNGATSFCAGGSVALSGSTGPGYTYQWQNNGTNISGATSSDFVADSSGLFDVVVSASNCSATSTEVQVAVTPYPNNTVTPAGTVGICAGDSVTLNAPTGAGYTYQWIINSDSLLAGGVNSTLTVSDSSSYNVIISLGACVDTSASTLVVTEPLPNAAIVQSNNTLYASAGGTSYQWFEDTTLITGATGQAYTPTQNGTYSVLVTDSAGCSTLSSPFVFVASGIFNTAGPLVNLTVYPNPTHNAITVILDIANNASTSLKLYDLLGNEVALVFEGMATTGRNSYPLSMSNLPQGIYLLRADLGSTMVTRKVVKQ